MNIYKKIPSFSDFNDIFNKSNYIPVPDDWFVIITDIESSTDWVKKGKYREVNTIGAACIGSIKTIKEDIPFVFGGDGASFVIPSIYKDEVINNLLKVKNSAKSHYNFNLRIGCVPVKDIYDNNYDLKIAKFELANKEFLAKFSGGGLSFADTLIKENIKYQISSENNEMCGFKNLSCRWQNIPNTRGTILTLIIKSKDLDSYSTIYKKLNNIVSLKDSILNPVKINHMKYKSLNEMIKDEAGYESNKFSFKYIFRLIEISACFLIFNKLRNYMPSFLKKYAESMAKYSDYRKFDDVFRMVLDCSKDEASKIEHLLKNTKEISYGIHKSETALMTCLVENLNDGGHIHFIDGADGGYTLAAKQFKEQISKTAA